MKSVKFPRTFNPIICEKSFNAFSERNPKIPEKVSLYFLKLSPKKKVLYFDSRIFFHFPLLSIEIPFSSKSFVISKIESFVLDKAKIRCKSPVEEKYLTCKSVT